MKEAWGPTAWQQPDSLEYEHMNQGMCQLKGVMSRLCVNVCWRERIHDSDM